MSKRNPGCALILEEMRDGKKIRYCRISSKTATQARKEYEDPTTDDGPRVIVVVPFRSLENGEGEATALSHLLLSFRPEMQGYVTPWDALEELLMELCEGFHAKIVRDEIRH